ncbi:asparagine synthase [Streptococcus sanguinis]|uniref:asparagine synthase n=1 Tax=Streptococcus sanguinis TaxID=1305 RepID=UPI001CBE4B5B|nr:asparagine synthase [Streptococcus sanguinis]MBZ2021411.1 asparagine synthase [Streptococcus sanguinis]MBZ2073744.1 asparagine synthase [Streptococcus sanguinis]MBZ2081667.1 asparagine synthase [Streptococcus sanguinis]MCC3165745.1 putative rNA pyrophosphohydrolase [Streptococcus sanguinis]
MRIYTIQKDRRAEEENPYSVWLGDELIENQLSFGEALYWSFRELQRWVQLGYLTQEQADGMRGDIEAYNSFVSRLTGA